jgi:tetratricopeptide (TPR) repeat protein
MNKHPFLSRVLSVSVLIAMVGGAGISPGCKPSAPVETLAEEDSQNPTKNFQNGVALLTTPDRNGLIDYATAYTRFTTAANLAGGDASLEAKAHYNAAWVAEVLGKPTDAETHFRAAYEADAANEKAMFSLARVLTEQGKHAEAVALYRGYVTAHPDTLEVRNDLVTALSEAGMYEEAIAEAQQILMKDPKNATVYRNLSAMYYKQGNYGMSQLCSEKSLGLNEGDPGTYNNLGVTFLLQNDEQAAIEKFKTAVKLDGDNYESNMNLGFVALNSGDYALALNCFQQASTANPASVDARLGLAVALRGTMDYEKAGAVYDEIIRTDPQNEVAYFNAATLHEKYTKDYTRAQKILEAYIEAKSGTIGPTHEVFTRIEAVKASKAEEEAKEAERKRVEEEKRLREERALAVLKELEGTVSSMKAKISTNGACLDPTMVEEINMMIEQADLVIAEKDTGMATDVKTMLSDAYGPMLDQAILDSCGGAAPTPPAPEGTDTPAETPTEPVPVEGTP